MNEQPVRLRTAEFDRLCVAKGLKTGKEICEALDISPAQLYKLRAGQFQPGPKFTHNALTYFQVPYVVLFERAARAEAEAVA